MEQMEMTRKELAEIIGYKSRVSEFFSRKRKLTLNMIRNLHDKMNIPYESLITNHFCQLQNQPNLIAVTSEQGRELTNLK